MSTPYPRVGVDVILTNRDGLVLLGKRNGSHVPYWSIPGGHFELGEIFESAAICAGLYRLLSVAGGEAAGAGNRRVAGVGSLVAGLKGIFSDLFSGDAASPFAVNSR